MDIMSLGAGVVNHRQLCMQQAFSDVAYVVSPTVCNTRTCYFIRAASATLQLKLFFSKHYDDQNINASLSGTGSRNFLTLNELTIMKVSLFLYRLSRKLSFVITVFVISRSFQKTSATHLLLNIWIFSQVPNSVNINIQQKVCSRTILFILLLNWKKKENSTIKQF